MKLNMIIYISLAIALQVKAQTKFGDRDHPILLCTKTSMMIRELNGPGLKSYEVESSSCSDRFVERHSVWLEWEGANNGNLTFQITPLNDQDDLDFILYRKSPGRSSLEELRCMAAGEMIGGDIERSLPCKGKTGLYAGTEDLLERDGCVERNDNYLSDLKQDEGVNYLLLVNNYNSDAGFTLDFGGSATFRMPTEPKQTFPKSYPKGLEIARSVTYLTDVYQSKLVQKHQKPAGREWIFADLWTSARKCEYTLVGCRSTEVASKSINRDDKLPETAQFFVGDPFPDPAAQSAQIEIKSDRVYDGLLEIRDLFGRIIELQKISIAKGPQTLNLPIERLSAGTYLASIRIEGTQHIRKFVKITY